MEGEQTEYVWGVVDFVPDTDFPDIRNKCVIHSNNGTCMVIPREDDKIRLYIQLDRADTSTMKRIDKSQMSAHHLFDVCTRFFQETRIMSPTYSWNHRLQGNHFSRTLSKLQRILIGGLFISVRQISRILFFDLCSSVISRTKSSFEILS